MSALRPGTSGSGSGLPAGGTALQVLHRDAGNAVEWGDPGDVVGQGLAAIYGSEPAGTTVVSDGAGSLALAVVETALPRLAVSGALHHWRCDEGSSPFADLGSAPVGLAHVAGTREYGRAHVYPRYGATMQRSPTATDRAEAVIADVPAGSDFTIEVTAAWERGTKGMTDLVLVASVSNGLGAGVAYGVYLLVSPAGDASVAVHLGSLAVQSAVVQVDWSRPCRLAARYVDATRTATLYIDGVVTAAFAAPASGTMAALTRAAIGGHVVGFFGVAGSSFLTTDFTVHPSALSAATLLARADVCRRLAAG